MSWRSKLAQKKFRYIVGLAGICPPECIFARRMSLIFSWCMLLIAFLLLVQWQWVLSDHMTAFMNHFINYIVYGFFGLVFVVEMTIVKDHIRFLLQNWSLPVILLSGCFIIFQLSPISTVLEALRPLLALYIVLPTLRRVLGFFFDGNITTTILGAAIVVIIFGILVAGVDPGVKTVWEGIWWAIATVSTIGYGDVVPTSPLGRILGIILVILGLGIFVIITANILAIALRRERKKFAKEEHEVEEILDELKEMRSEQEKQIKMVEKLLNAKNDKSAE